MKQSQDERRREDRERLEQATRELLTSEGWQRWLETRKRFHTYSLNNQLLIAIQCPEATRVAGYKTWQSLGRQVVKGSKGIRILAPMKIKRDVETATGGTETKQFLLFKCVSVFDVSQTEGDPLPENPATNEPLTGDSHADYLPALETFAASIGAPVRYETLGREGGYWDKHKGEIVLADRHAPNAAVRVLVHEIAHALGGIDYTRYTREHAESIVEAVAYVVCSGLGLDTSGSSVGYVAGWGADDIDALRTYAETIHTLATKIETALEPVPKERARELVTA